MSEDDDYPQEEEELETESFLHVKIEDMNYLFFIVFSNRYKTPIIKELQDQFEPFGTDLGRKGMVVRAVDSAIEATVTEVLEKEGWPKSIFDRLLWETDPFMLVIKTDFETFCPDIHPWSIIWFSEYRENPGSIYRLLSHLAKVTQMNMDIYTYLSMLSKKKKLKEFINYFDIKPGIFGISIDIKKAFMDLLVSKKYD